jgi:hypothetical protein
MKTNEELYNEHLNRLKTAIALEKPDRVPVSMLGNAFCAHHLGVSMGDFCTKPEVSANTMLKSFTSLGEVDCTQVSHYFAPILSIFWLSRVKIPGQHLPDDALWQVSEAELMKEDDYDYIINNGFQTFLNKFYAEFIDNYYKYDAPNYAAWVGNSINYAGVSIPKFAEAGIVTLCPGFFTTPYEYFCGGRTLAKFIRDLYRIPDKVQAAMDVAINEMVEGMKAAIRGAHLLGGWIGGWRSASEFNSPKIFDRFVWPYFRKLTLTAIEEGMIPTFHLDSNWERSLDHFMEFPKEMHYFT